MNQLENKVAIVTGAGRGIGRAIALAYAAEGASVMVASRSTATVKSTVADIKALGGTATGMACDVGMREEVESMVAATVQEFGRLDIIVNNAQGFGTPEKPEGSPGYVPLESYQEDMWDHINQSGLKGTLYGMQAAFPHLREAGGGKIINFGSGNGITAMPGTAAYNSAKEAVRALTRTAATEWGKYNICSNVIIPTMATDSAKDFLERRPGIEEKLVKQIPLRRLGNVEEDIGPVAVFLASDASNFITGQTLHVDGGQILHA